MIGDEEQGTAKHSAQLRCAKSHIFAPSLATPSTPAEHKAEENNHSPGPCVGCLDGVRVIAAFTVVAHHFGALDVNFQTSANIQDLQFADGRSSSIMNRGLEGVQVPWVIAYIAGVGPGHIAVESFLTVAGFVAAYGTWQKGGSADTYEKRLFKRYFRIAIPLLPVHLVNGLLFHFSLTHGNYAQLPSRENVAASYAAGLFRFVYASDLNGALWVVEAFFLAPFVAAGVQIPVLRLAAKYRGIWYAGCLVYCLGNVVNVETISQQLSVVVGVVLADLYFHNWRAIVSKKFLSAASLCALISVLALLMASPYLPRPFYGQGILIRLSSWAFVCTALFVRWTQCIFSNCLMRRMSKYTYEVYIWHLLVFHFFAHTVVPKFSGSSLFGIYALAVLLVIPVSVMAYHIVEKPGASLTQRLTNWMFQDSHRVEQLQS